MWELVLILVVVWLAASVASVPLGVWLAKYLDQGKEDGVNAG